MIDLLVCYLTFSTLWPFHLTPSSVTGESVSVERGPKLIIWCAEGVWFCFHYFVALTLDPPLSQGSMAVERPKVDCFSVRWTFDSAFTFTFHVAFAFDFTWFDAVWFLFVRWPSSGSPPSFRMVGRPHCGQDILFVYGTCFGVVIQSGPPWVCMSVMVLIQHLLICVLSVRSWNGIHSSTILPSS